MEDLVISAIYAGLVSGTLDPYKQLVNLSSVSPLRDLPPNSIPSMLNTLNEWSARCVSTLVDLERQIASVKAEALKRHKEEQEWTLAVEKLIDGKAGEKGKKDEDSGGFFGNVGRKLGGGGASKREMEDDDYMELDEDDGDSVERRGSRSKKRGLLGGFGK